ncbi:MAG: alpha/beta fold hydrolase [Bdellovibrionales bacterium]
MKRRWVLVLGLSVMGISFAYWIHLRTKRLPQESEVLGIRFRYVQSGEGPNLVVLPSSQPQGDVLEEFSQDLSSKVRVTAIDWSAFQKEPVKGILEALKHFGITESILVARDDGAKQALALARSSGFKAHRLILLSPKITPDLEQNLTKLPIRTLILWGRQNKNITATQVQRLALSLGDAEFSFDPKSNENLLKQNPDWVRRKILAFLGL